MEIISAIIINLIDHKKIKGYENLEIFYGKNKLYTNKEKIKNLKKQFLDKFNVNIWQKLK